MKAAFVVLFLMFCELFVGVSTSALAQTAKPPAVGEAAPDFTLKGLDNQSVKLSELLKQGPVSLIMLRGFPGYQCPLCTKQVGELIENASAFEKSKTTIVLVYPGDAKGLNSHAKQFIGSREFPSNIRFLLDPDFQLVNAYGLRWNEPQETAYPASFVIAPNGKVSFAKISKSHAGRVAAKELLEIVNKN
jgi:thioredoxin-dependent peroxiredoxin